MTGDLIDPRDFKSVKLEVSLNNTTTHNEIRRKDRLQVLELLERGMVLEVPARSCGKGHYLVLTIDVTDTEDKESQFKTGAKVEEVEGGEGSDRVTVSLLQHDRDGWERFNTLFNSRQEEIMKFLTAVKGHE